MNLKTILGISSRPVEFNRWSAILLVILIVTFIGSQFYLGITSFFEK